METIKLGHKVKDRVTGFTGIAIAECIYLNGCIQFEIAPKVDSKGEKRNNLWIDEQQLEFIDHGVLLKPEPIKKERKIRFPGGGFRNHPK